MENNYNGKWFKEKELLEQLICNEKLSYEEIGRRYGCSGANIKKISKKLGINLIPKRQINPNETFNRKIIKNIREIKKVKKIKNFLTNSKEIVEPKYCVNCGSELTKHAVKYCCKTCENQYKHKQAYAKYLEESKDIMRANYSPKNFKDLILKEQDNKCAICGMSPNWNGKNLVFILDHIDGHAANNKRNNIRLICPNCDSQLDTYKFRNKNSDRHYYRYGHKNNIN